MNIDHLLTRSIQLQGVPGLDLLPTDNQLTIFLKKYLIACHVEGKSPSTLSIYGQMIGQFIRFSDQHGFPDDPGKVTASDIRLFLLSQQQRGLSPASVNAYYRPLKTFFNWLVTEGFINEKPGSPMEKIKPPRIPRKIVRPFSRQDIDNLLLVSSGTRFIDLRNRAIVLLFLDTGLRLAELAAIQLDELDFTRETIKVMGKGAKERIVRMGKVTQKALLRYLLARDDQYECLWVTEERRPMTRMAVQTMIKRLCRRAEIEGPKRGPHTFRHTAAISFLRNGGGEFTLQMMLGHSTLEMTRRYVSSLGADEVVKAHQKASPVDNLGIR